MMVMTKPLHMIFVSHTTHFYLENISLMGTHGQIQFLLSSRSIRVDISKSFCRYRTMYDAYFPSLSMLGSTYTAKSNTEFHTAP